MMGMLKCQTRFHPCPIFLKTSSTNNAYAKQKGLSTWSAGFHLFHFSVVCIIISISSCPWERWEHRQILSIVDAS